MGKTETKPQGGSSQTGDGSGGSSEPFMPPKTGEMLTAKDGNVYTVAAGGSVVEFTKAANKNTVSASIPSSVTINQVKYQVTAIRANAFTDCKKLKKVKIPASVTAIGDGAIYELYVADLGHHSRKGSKNREKGVL